MNTKERIKEKRNEVLKEFDDLMDMIDNKVRCHIDEFEIQRQLGVVFHEWKQLTDLQKGVTV